MTDMTNYKITNNGISEYIINNNYSNSKILLPFKDIDFNNNDDKSLKYFSVLNDKVIQFSEIERVSSIFLIKPRESKGISVLCATNSILEICYPENSNGYVKLSQPANNEFGIICKYKNNQIGIKGSSENKEIQFLCTEQAGVYNKVAT